MPSEGGRGADYERGSRHSKKQISHGTYSFVCGALVRRQIHLLATIPKRRFCSLIRIKSSKTYATPTPAASRSPPVPPQSFSAHLFSDDDTHCIFDQMTTGLIDDSKRLHDRAPPAQAVALTNVKDHSLFCGICYDVARKPGSRSPPSPSRPRRSGPFQYRLPVFRPWAARRSLLLPRLVIGLIAQSISGCLVGHIVPLHRELFELALHRRVDRLSRRPLATQGSRPVFLGL